MQTHTWFIIFCHICQPNTTPFHVRLNSTRPSPLNDAVLAEIKTQNMQRCRFTRTQKTHSHFPNNINIQTAPAQNPALSSAPPYTAPPPPDQVLGDGEFLWSFSLTGLSLFIFYFHSFSENGFCLYWSLILLCCPHFSFSFSG